MMNVARNAAGGRNWEGAGADPFLQGVHAVANIKGIQSQGVIACAKHYALNEQEHYRGGGLAIASSSNADDRTFHEVYLWPFAASVKAGVGSGALLISSHMTGAFQILHPSYVRIQQSQPNILLREQKAT